MDSFNSEAEIYNEKEMKAVEKHIEKYYGKIGSVFHELYSPDIHVDICIIPPAKKRDYYLLVTMGMGAHKMNVPEQLSEYRLERAELMIALPPDWKIEEQDEFWYWPIRLLKSIARLPISANTWLGWGHTVDNQDPYADNTSLCGTVLLYPEAGKADGNIMSLPNGDDLNFYQLIPLYREEMEYKVANNTEALLEKMENVVPFVVRIDRANAVESCEDEEMGLLALTLDDVQNHIESITEKNLPVDETAAYNHIAIYLRWFIEHDMMSDMFTESFEGTVNEVKANKNTPESIPDLRLLLSDPKLKGRLMLTYFNDEGAEFSEWYYGIIGELSDDHYYPCDVDSYAKKYFGTERYNSDEFQDEAYLFVPWNEEYYMGMAEIIDKNYKRWKAEEH